MLRYIRLPLEDAQLLWDKTYKAAGAKVGAGGRVRKIALLSGLVLPVWDAVQVSTYFFLVVPSHSDSRPLWENASYTSGPTAFSRTYKERQIETGCG